MEKFINSLKRWSSLGVSTALAAAGAAQPALDRTTLPIPEPKHSPITTLNARNAEVPPPVF